MLATLATLFLLEPVDAGPAPCSDVTNALGVSRKVAIDSSTGNLFGSMTSLPREPSFLHAREVVLTFDDGPMPWVTKSILDTLDQFCTKATFFSVGRMALAYPSVVRDVVDRGHTLGSHTFSHPFRLPRLAPRVAKDEIDRGVAAVSTAAQIEIAPFFRFPGLAASPGLVKYAASRGLVTFTVDVVSNDSFTSDPNVLTERTLAEIEKRGRGIILFHDIKSTTAKALPAILAGLAQRGYRIVHMVARTPAQPRPDLMAELAQKSLKPAATLASRAMPFYGTTGPAKLSPVAPALRGASPLVAKTKEPAASAKQQSLPEKSAVAASPDLAKLPSPGPKGPKPTHVNLSLNPKDAPTATSPAKTVGTIRDDSLDLDAIAPEGSRPTGPPVVAAPVNTVAEPELPRVFNDDTSAWTANVSKEAQPTIPRRGGTR